jgi:hypothetical protein
MLRLVAEAAAALARAMTATEKRMLDNGIRYGVRTEGRGEVKAKLEE